MTLSMTCSFSDKTIPIRRLVLVGRLRLAQEQWHHVAIVAAARDPAIINLAIN